MTNRRVLAIITIVLFSSTFVSCKYNKIKDEEENNKTEIAPKHENVSWDGEKIARLITENEEKYPQSDIRLLEDKDFKARLKSLTGEDYEEIMENFNTETPIVSDRNVYKFTGCKEHNCPSFLTTVLYDAKTGNMNVLVSKNGKTQIFEENGKITTSKALRVK